MGNEVKKLIDKFEKMKNDPQVEEQLIRAEKTLIDLKSHQETLEARKNIYKSFKSGSLGLKKQLKSFKINCEEFINSIDWYENELKRRKINENFSNLDESRKKAKEYIYKVIELEAKISIKKYGANESKILTLKSCKSAIENLNSIINELKEFKNEKSIKKTKEAVEKYSSLFQYSKKCLPDVNKYKKFYEKVNKFIDDFNNSVKDLRENIDKFKKSPPSDDGWMAIIESKLNLITKEFIIDNVISGAISSATGIFINYIFIPGLIYAWKCL